MCNIRTILAFMSIIVILIPTVHFLIRAHGDVTLIIENLQYTLPFFTAALRIIIFWWNKEALSSVMDMIADDWIKEKTSWERIKMITRAQTARTIATFLYSMMGTSFFIAMIMPICGISMYVTNGTNSEKQLPFQTLYYTYDTNKSPQYELTFLSQTISTLFGIVTNMGIDNFLNLLVFHICGQLDILKNRITHLDQFTNYAHTLKNCVIDHIRIIRAITVIEDAYNLMLLALLLSFGIIFAFYGFLILSILEDETNLSIFQLMFRVLVMLTISGHMCAYCVVGDILVSQCNGIHYAAYSNKWYTVKPKDARNLISILIRTNEPIYLTAGKMFPMTMATFSNLIKTSAGYISVLLTARH
ncbi:Odorant receptor 045 [Nylanderia fulva]|uniref:Odorant receptor n=1 Tax=Nylanderia fulva TaxID=613905 RepID=A0A6G1LRC9_9HYME|nr:Odorant receptor 045 [Nylanderia fulva]